MARWSPVRRSLDQRPDRYRCRGLRRRGLLMAVALFSGLLAGHAQSTTTGGLEGTITDVQGRVVPGVRLVARCAATGKERAATSGAQGSFRIADLDPDTYAIEATTANFAPWRAPSVSIEVGQNHEHSRRIWLSADTVRLCWCVRRPRGWRRARRRSRPT